MSVRQILGAVSWLVCGMVLAGCCVVDTPPVARFTWRPQDPIAHQEVQFEDLSTDVGGPLGGGGVVAWEWDFGDGAVSSSRNPVHIYRKAGIYRVRLRVTDACGKSSTDERDIRVGVSLTGTWTGQLIDLARQIFDLTLEISHSPTGGITGRAVVLGRSSPFISASFDGQEVRISFAYAGTGNTWLLVGRYYAGDREDRLVGYWINVTWDPGRIVGDWEVRRTY